MALLIIRKREEQRRGEVHSKKWGGGFNDISKASSLPVIKSGLWQFIVALKLFQSLLLNIIIKVFFFYFMLLGSSSFFYYYYYLSELPSHQHGIKTRVVSCCCAIILLMSLGDHRKNEKKKENKRNDTIFLLNDFLWIVRVPCCNIMIHILLKKNKRYLLLILNIFNLMWLNVI